MFALNKLLNNIRFYILLFSLVLSINIYFFVPVFFDSETIQIIRLTQVYALLAIFFLYFALLAGPFCYTFRRFPYRAKYLKARRALGVSSFYFAVLHAFFAFFGQLGGFQGLQFLPDTYLLAIGLSFFSLHILALLSLTSFDKIIARMSFRRWKMLHRFVYLAGIFILIHLFMLGTHFQDLSTLPSQILFIALIFLLFLETIRIDTFFKKRFPQLPLVSLLTIFIFMILILVFLQFFVFSKQKTKIPALGIHAEHLRLAKLAQQETTPQRELSSSISGMNGDRTKRYTVSFIPPLNPQPGENIEIRFKVFDASNGNPVSLFNKTYGEVAHLIIVDSELEYFTHLHPFQKDSEFWITASLPHSGKYHLYLDFQPFGAIEQQFAFTLDIGEFNSPAIAKNQTKESKKIFDGYEVTLDTSANLQAQKMSVGERLFTFTIKDARTKKPITTLKPYLQAFGHLVMINQQTYDYIHVHPTALRVPKPDENGGPTVEFLPLGLYGPIKPGTYRVFAQFNPDNNLFTSDFTIEVK